MKNVNDFEALPEVFEQVNNVCKARHIGLADFLKLFDKSIHEKINKTLKIPGVTHIVCFENLDMWSSRFGHRQALIVGEKPEGAEVPSWSLEKVLTTPYFRLGDVPSRFLYPVAYAAAGGPQQQPEPGQAEPRDASTGSRAENKPAA